jgi:hypothetical protein
MLGTRGLEAVFQILFEGVIGGEQGRENNHDNDDGDDGCANQRHAVFAKALPEKNEQRFFAQGAGTG